MKTRDAVAWGLSAASAIAGVAFAVYYIKTQGGGGGGGSLVVTFDVVNSNGDPIDGASISFAGQTQSTNFLGQATFSGVGVGVYTATFSAQNYATASEPVTITETATSFQMTMLCSLSSSSCPCEDILDKDLCVCSPLVPAAIFADAVAQVSLGWQVNVCCYLIGSSLTSVIALGENPTCPDTEISGGYPSTTFDLTGTVADSGGNPICNQSVIVSGIPAQTEPFNVGGVEGYFEVSYPSSVTTGSDGTFDLPITLTLVVTGWNCYYTAVPSTPNASGTTDVSFVVNYRVSGTTIQGYTTVNAAALICGDFFLC